MKLKPEHQANTWQGNCTEALVQCVREGSPEGWDYKKRKFSEKKRIVIADADFTGANLSNFDLSRCYIIRCEFERANLQKAIFRQAMIRDSSFARADLRGASLEKSDFLSGSLYEVVFDNKTNLNLGSLLREVNHARPALAEEVRRQQYIDDLNRSRKTRLSKGYHKLLLFGSSLRNFAWMLLGINALFFLAYLILGQFNYFEQNHAGVFETLVLTLQRFFNTQSTVDSPDIVVKFLLALHSALGLIALGIFTALLSKRLVATLR